MDLLAAYELDEPPAEPPGGRPLLPRLLSAMLGAVAAAAVVGVTIAMRLHRIQGWSFGTPQAHWILGGAVVAAAFVVQLLPRRHRPLLLAVLGVALTVVVLRLQAALLLSYAAVVIVLARPRRFLAWRVLAVALVWAALPVARWHFLPPATSLKLMPVVLLWVGLVYSALYLLVEHRRAGPGKFTLADDVLYLTAPPRLMAVFFQPISPGLVKAAARDMDLRRCGRAIALGLYGAGLLAFGTLIPRLPQPHDPWLHFARRFLVYYAMAAGHIFVAVSAFRALGIHLPSGFHWPFASQSFAEFFRRWNHYIRDAVLSLFYFPFLGMLRRWMPHRAAEIIAPYLAIICGAFLLNDVLAPMVTNLHPWVALRQTLTPIHLVTLVVFWSFIILPRQLLPRRKAKLRGWRAWLAWGRFMVLYLIIFRLGWGLFHHR